MGQHKVLGKFPGVKRTFETNKRRKCWGFISCYALARCGDTFMVPRDSNISRSMLAFARRTFSTVELKPNSKQRVIAVNKYKKVLFSKPKLCTKFSL